MEKPAAAEIRALPSAGVLGVIELTRWATDSPEKHLWASSLFDAAFIALSIVTIFGMVIFFQHWRSRAIAPAMIVAAYALVAFGSPVIYVLIALGLAFVAVAYFVSPDRNIHNGTTSRFAPYVAVKGATSTQADSARGRVLTFEPLNVGDLSEERFKAWEEEFRSSTKLDQVLFTYRAHFEIENSGPPFRPRNWRFSIRTKAGAVVACDPVDKDWDIPKSWPGVEYTTLARIQSEFLESNKVYHVSVAVPVANQPMSALDMRSFQVRFTDGSGSEVVCRQVDHGGEITQAAQPLIVGQVMRFEAVDAYYLSEWRVKDLERELGRSATSSERFGNAMRVPGGNWYIALLQVETVGTKSKAVDWRCTVRLKDGEEIPCLLMVQDWGAPRSWPAMTYHNLGEMQSIFLENQYLYNVLVHVRLEQSEPQLNMSSFTIRFFDDRGAEIVCSMQKPSR